MNVYELADALEKIETYNQVIHRSFNDKTKLTASADMLRKQADRIAELERINKFFQLLESNAKNRIAGLEKDLAKYDELAIDDLKGRGIVWCACGDAITPDSGAVCGNCACTHPAKTLTDEEIHKIYCEVEDTKCPSDDFEYMMFARAILRKAQEADKIESLGTVNIGGVHFRNGKEVK